MTKGSPAKLIFTFAIPLMLGNVFQQFYTVVDTAIVGQALGVNALAALGAADWLNWLVLGLIQGFAQGFSIYMAQRFGAEDHEGLNRSIGATISLSAVISILTVILSQVAMAPVLRAMNTPEEIIGGAFTYLRIMFAGIPIIMAYNVLASILRALGDSKTPLWFLYRVVRRQHRARCRVRHHIPLGRRRCCVGDVPRTGRGFRVCVLGGLAPFEIH